MRLIEARDRGILTGDQVKEYLRRGYTLGSEIGLDTNQPVVPVATSIDFQSKKGVRVALGTAETDAANLANVTARVASVDISASNHASQGIPVLVTDVPILINEVLLVNTEAFDNTVKLGISGTEDKYVPDSKFDKTVNEETDPILVGIYVPNGVNINLYMGANTTGVGKFYMLYTRLG
jgi:hypothetical protein